MTIWCKCGLGPGLQDLTFQLRALEQYFDKNVLFENNRSSVFQLFQT